MAPTHHPATDQSETDSSQLGEPLQPPLSPVQAPAPTVSAAEDADDDGYATDDASNTSTSLTSSVRDYQFDNSRRYHKYAEGRYQFPNDEPEQEREDMKHAMVVHACDGKLHFAPLVKPRDILDVGTGTGIWAIDMGDEYPEAEVKGIDLSPIQPMWLPPNVRFWVDDAEAEWVQPPSSLDHVHIRHMTNAIRDWPTLLARAFQALRPGGWIELQELRFELESDDGTLQDGNMLNDFFRNVGKGLKAFGVDLWDMKHNKQRVVDVGFINVEEILLKIPMGPWPKDPRMKMIGQYCRAIIVDALHGASNKSFTHGLKWSPNEIELYLVAVRHACMDNSSHAHIPFHAVTAQKPC
ncbi:S-adenosyl-L-methionine-dependent methyltransferase [Emericellopsis atlantica]|uniref:S-adenosyl-L-methionine-dependent methyltransferase n=1 Tax=Emericellopsis atlantica TaxID=2614577 RepID=A0A9P7ZHB5_9HYPO|nr:S-adenosyl-L-methionine-dependent methyltransferase [Emericellopsis atlantica]KAG9251827.1 S-adenosyl-L-methionine-dependent methyltransferase [Emericellopsis atlantica]